MIYFFYTWDLQYNKIIAGNPKIRNLFSWQSMCLLQQIHFQSQCFHLQSQSDPVPDFCFTYKFWHCQRREDKRSKPRQSDSDSRLLLQYTVQYNLTLNNMDKVLSVPRALSGINISPCVCWKTFTNTSVLCSSRFLFKNRVTEHQRSKSTFNWSCLYRRDKCSVVSPVVFWCRTRFVRPVSTRTENAMNVFDRNMKRKQKNWAAALQDAEQYDYLRTEVISMWKMHRIIFVSFAFMCTTYNI